MDQPLESLGSTRSTRRASYQHSWPTLHLPCSGQHLLQSQAEQQASLCQLPRVPIRSSGRGLTGELFSPLCFACRLWERGLLWSEASPSSSVSNQEPYRQVSMCKAGGIPNLQANLAVERTLPATWCASANLGFDAQDWRPTLCWGSSFAALWGLAVHWAPPRLVLPLLPSSRIRLLYETCRKLCVPQSMAFFSEWKLD